MKKQDGKTGWTSIQISRKEKEDNTSFIYRLQLNNLLMQEEIFGDTPKFYFQLHTGLKTTRLKLNYSMQRINH